MISVGDTVKFSPGILTFIKDFKGEEDYRNTKDTVMLVVDISNLKEVSVFSPSGEIITLEETDVQLFAKHSQEK